MTETQVVEYNVTDAAIAEMSDLYMGLVITNLEDKEQFDAVRSARLVVKGKRIEVDKKRKELKADALAWGKKVQTEANRIFALIEPIENISLLTERDSQPGILNFNDHPVIAVFAIETGSQSDYPSLRRVIHGIGKQIREDLPNKPAVASDRGKVILQIKFKRQALTGGKRSSIYRK